MYKSLLFIISFIIFLYTGVSEAYQYIAFSLKEAKRSILYSSNKSINIRYMCGITEPVAILYDKANDDDIIIVGKNITKKNPLSLDDFSVALRSILKYQKSPLVSIDRKLGHTEKKGEYVVRFEGKIENTKFGEDLLEADIVLKKIGLGKLPTDIWGISSYFDMSSDHWKETNEELPISSRFWFKPDDKFSRVALKDSVAVVQRLKIEVMTEVEGIQLQGKTNIKPQDEIGDIFASKLTTSFENMCLYYPILSRLDQLFRLTGLAEGIKRWKQKYGMKLSMLDYWINDYRVEYKKTKEAYPVLKSISKKTQNGKIRTMTIEGGVDLSVLALDLMDGSLLAFKTIVLKSRPTNTSLKWEIPLDKTWDPYSPKCFVEDIEKVIKSNVIKNRIGMSLEKNYSYFSNNSLSTSIHSNIPSVNLNSFSSSVHEIPSVSFTNSLPSYHGSSNIGGVMLQGVAKSSVGDVKINITGGNFSLIIDNENAYLKPSAFKKFITALWSTYFTNQDPGISIDPIAPGSKKHLVRYIGQVMNNDLGRVMREADYVMKKWAVGTERPDIKGFMNPDDISAKKDIYYVGAWSRFWFVPENMSFKRGGNMLIFDDGRMTVQTEYLLLNNERKADPANMEFANFFTKNYDKISEKYPVYRELFEYAKLVSLTKYLKENNIPLLWFLMANKDLVITEDSKSTVDALIKDSEHLKGVYIEGGVELTSKGNYIYDEEAIKAINDAITNIPKTKNSETSLINKKNLVKTGSGHFSFNLEKGSFSVIPQHTLTSGKDRRGIRYQTDLAIKASGFKLTRRSLEYLKSTIIKKRVSIKLNNTIKANDKVNKDLAYIQIHREVYKEVIEIIKKLSTLINKDFESESELFNAIDYALSSKQAEKIKALVIKYAYYKTNIELVRYYLKITIITISP